MIKKIFFQIHWFLGITAGLILSIIGVTGAIYSYDQQILQWMNPQSYTVKVESHNKLSPEQIYLHFQQKQPEMQINSINIEQAANASSSINIVKEGARRGKTIYINPYNAEILPEIKGQEFFQFIQRLHRYLTLGDVGKQITGASTLILIFFVLSGIYLRWPKKHSLRQWLALKPQLKGRNFIWDLHAVVGTWMVVFYLIMAMTGLFWSYDWWRSGMYNVLNVTPPSQLKSDNNNKEKGKKDFKKITPEQTATALATTWTGFNTQIQQPYSSVTFTLPKKADGLLEISFVDATPQHERARNKANFNYELNQLNNVELYQDKKLNEKIMSSMLPVHRGSFFGSIVQFMFMIAALLMPLFFITGLMLYLKRRKQKKQVLSAKNALQATQIDENANNWLIVFASQTGVAEQLAWLTANSLKENKQCVEVCDIQQLKAQTLKNAEYVLFIASTYGTGEAPDTAQSFVKNMMSTSLELNSIQYAVLALGSKEYAESYCAFGEQLYDWFKQNGATALFPLIKVNNASPEDIQQWNQALAMVTASELQQIVLEKHYSDWILKHRQHLNPNSLGSAVHRIELEPMNEQHWEAGDIAEVQPQNSLAHIHAFLTQYPWLSNQDQNVIEQRLCDRDLNNPITYSPDLEQVLAQLPQLPSREYSIASIPSQGSLHLIVRQQYNEQNQIGLGSGWLTEHCPISGKLKLHLRSNPSFHLITGHQPIICIGNGTGIAGLMSLLKQRIENQDHDNWLIFGERQRSCDFYYQDQLEDWLKTGKLQHLDVAFSRDQQEKYYVHHLLREQSTRLREWIERGAIIYVCGSLQSMARDVDQALIDILGIEKVEQLREKKAYRRDVY
ncbi:sulfite reductase flavoprotein subunit alpha [Acinetobacter rudis]|uniref:sulfite reductase flavoprotein subunit alpha n=1 Tax=Acinetobacter rudis TaxID=632955 RepID=UPI00281085DA|nr:sulfite reductase flavoprotein subunit alpha [Acinetobacter rudis]MDQ8953798.1 sulfite reductase flavoprotein subunit alpha [Acinetobacter rudis]